MPNPVQGGTIGRTDQGVDISGRPGARLTDPVPGRSQLVGSISNWYAGQPFYWFKVLTGKFKDRFWYVAEQVNLSIRPGGQVDQGQQIGTYASSGTATEWGWATASGATLARASGQVGSSTANTAAGRDFGSQILRAPAGTGVDTWRVTASQESLGGVGSCGHAIQADGYSELSTVPMGVSSDFAALGKLPCGTVLNITNPSNGKTVQAAKQDVGAGSSFLPVMGLYPATAQKLGLAGGQYTVLISRADGQPLHPVRGTQVSGSASGASPITRPGGGSSADTGAAVDALFQAYEQELNLPRTAPQGFSGKNPFQWWWQSFTGGGY